MAAGVVHERGAWWVWTDHNRDRNEKRFGGTAADKRRAEETAAKVNAAITLGTYGVEPERPKAIACDEALRSWITSYAPTLKLSHEDEARRMIERHLVPHFGAADLRTLTELDLLGYIKARPSSRCCAGCSRSSRRGGGGFRAARAPISAPSFAAWRSGPTRK